MSDQERPPDLKEENKEREKSYWPHVTAPGRVWGAEEGVPGAGGEGTDWGSTGGQPGRAACASGGTEEN